jgi:hypothetical protein
LASASAAQAQSAPLAGNGVSTSPQNHSAMPPPAPDPKDTIAPQNGTADVEVALDQGGHARLHTSNYTDGPEGAPKRTFRRASS